MFDLSLGRSLGRGGSDPRAQTPTATVPSRPASRRAAAPPSIHRLRVRAPPSRSASPARGCSWTTRRRTTTARTPATGRRSSPARTIRWCHPTISFSSTTVSWSPGRSRISRAAPGIRASTSPAATRRRSPPLGFLAEGPLGVVEATATQAVTAVCTDRRTCSTGAGRAVTRRGDAGHVGSGDVSFSLPLFSLRSRRCRFVRLELPQRGCRHPGLVVDSGWSHSFAATLRATDARNASSIM